jgi:hypothetical protein
MRTLLVAAVALLGLAACSDGTPADPTATASPEPPEVTLTADERTDFLDRIGALGFTCRDALREDPAYVACTRPGRASSARLDTVRLTAGPDDEVVRVSYCGPDTEVRTAFSEAFLPELGSPPELPQTHETRGARVQGCNAVGFAAGAEVTRLLRRVDPEAVRGDLEAAGWECRDDAILSCGRGGDGRLAPVAWVAHGEVGISGRSQQVASALTDLGFDREVEAAATACGPDAPCEHLLVDGYDVTMSVDDGRTVVVAREAAWG